MSIGQSGRVVVEIDPTLKKQLYSVLASEGNNLKTWFVAQAKEYIRNQKSEPNTSDIKRR